MVTDLHSSVVKGKTRTIGARILLLWLAGQLGCFIGGQAYFWAFNSSELVLNRYVAEWQRFLWQLVNLRAIEYTIEFSLVSAPLALAAGVIACGICLSLRKWKLLWLCVFITFAVLAFLSRLAWKV